MAPVGHGAAVTKTNSEPFEPASSPVDFDFDITEVKRLRWLPFEASITDVVGHTWGGMCARNVWGYAIAETQLRGGSQFSRSILYESPVGRATRLVERRSMLSRSTRAQLGPADSCVSCHVDLSQRHSCDLTTAVSELPCRGAERVNRRNRTGDVVAERNDLWRLCWPDVVAGGGPKEGPGARTEAGRSQPRPAHRSARTRPAGGLLHPFWLTVLQSHHRGARLRETVRSFRPQPEFSG